MNIGIVCPYDMEEPGGVQQVCIELANHLREAGDEALLVAVGNYVFHGGPGLDDDTVPIGRPFKVRANDSIVPLTLSPRSWSRMRAALSGVDVVHIHEPMVPLAGWAALSTQKPAVMTFHADAPDWVGPVYRRAPLIRKRMARGVLTAVSAAARRSIPDVWGDVRIIPNAINASAYDLPVGKIGRRIAFLGRDEPRKGLDIALRAFDKIRESHPESELVVMGASRDDDIPGVRFLGRVSEGEKQRMLASSAIYVAPNTGGESFGIVLAEAMAAGCAVVASDLDAFRAVVGEHGILFPVGDDSALARKVVALLDDDTRRLSLSNSAKSAVQMFDWPNVLGMYRQAYEDALVSS